MPHYAALALGYLAALLGWFVVARACPALWPARPAPRLARPWEEFGWALLGAAAVVAVGQVYQRGMLLPHRGWWEPLADGLNQLLIFAPLLLVPLVRRQPAGTALVILDRLWLRVLVGLSLALLGVLVFTAVRANANTWLGAVRETYRYRNVDLAVQVLLEDVAIAILLVRLAAAAGARIALPVVAALFAAGHVPAMLAEGATAGGLARLVLDFGLGVGVMGTLWRSADVSWLWCVHFAMDMMQYYGTRSVA